MDNKKLTNEISPRVEAESEAYALFTTNPSRMPDSALFPQDVFSSILATAELASPGISHRIKVRDYISIVNAAIAHLSVAQISGTPRVNPPSSLTDDALTLERSVARRTAATVVAAPAARPVSQVRPVQPAQSVQTKPQPAKAGGLGGRASKAKSAKPKSAKGSDSVLQKSFNLEAGSSSGEPSLHLKVVKRALKSFRGESCQVPRSNRGDARTSYLGEKRINDP